VQSPVKFVVVGAGHMGTHHIKKIFEKGDMMGAHVSVIIEPDQKKIQSHLLNLPPQSRPLVLPNLGALVDVPAPYKPEAAIVAVPAGIHVEVAGAVLDMGLHCLYQ